MSGAPEETGLQRRLSSRQIAMIGLGGAIGTGLFLGSGLAISQAGPATILAHVACALVALVIAWALAEMVVVHPEAGAFGAVAHRYLGPFAGFVTRWTYWTIQVIAVGGEVIAAGIYVRFWWPAIPLWLPVAVFGVVVVAVNAATVRLFGTVEYWFAMVKVVAIVVFVLLGAVLVVFGLPAAPATGLHNLTADGGFLPKGWGGLLLAMVFVLFSYIGTEVVSVTAAESEDPVRDIPRAARRMVLRLALFYLLAITVVLTVVPWTVTAQGKDITASPFVRVFDSAGVPAAAAVMNLVVLTAALSSANTNLYLTTRMLHSLAGHGYAPRWTGRLTPSGVPRNALAVSGLGLVLAVALSWRQDNAAYLVLFGVSIFGALVVWLLILTTHAVFRRTRSAQGLPPSPVRLWGAPVTSGLAALFLAGVLVSTWFIDGLEPAWEYGVPFFALLVIGYFLTTRRTPPLHAHPRRTGRRGRIPPLDTPQEAAMSLLAQLHSAIAQESVRVVDLTAPLTESTPVLQLPAPFPNTINFQLEEISRYDERGPMWYWNNIHTGEHTGTHLDAPNHWVTGRDGQDVAQVPLRTLVAPAVVLDASEQVAKDPDYLLRIEDVRAWEAEHGALPDGGWLLYRTGWDEHSGDQERFLNADDTGSHTPGVAADCARWLAEETPIVGLGVETVGTDAGRAMELDPVFPCHHLILGAGKCGLTQLQNLAQLPATGALLVVCPLPIVGGSGSPARVLALVEG